METEKQPQAQASDMTQADPSAGEISELARIVEAKRRQFPQSEPVRKPPVETAIDRLSRIIPVSQEELARREAADREMTERYRRAERAGRWSSLVSKRGARYENCRLENFSATTDAQRMAVERLTDYAANIVERIGDGVNVILIGPAGTGKDHLMMGLCHAAIGAFRTLEWRNGTSLWLEFRHAIGEGEDEGRVIRRLVGPDVLSISDPVPPRGPLSDYQAAMLFDVIDARYSSRKPVWMTLNCANRAEAEDRIGAQVVDRMAHEALVVTCNWASYRRGEP